MRTDGHGSRQRGLVILPFIRITPLLLICLVLTGGFLTSCGPSNEEQLYQIGKRHTLTDFTLTFPDGRVFAFTEAELEQLTDHWHDGGIDLDAIIFIDQNGADADYHFKLSNGFEMSEDAKFLAKNGKHILTFTVWGEGGGFQADVWTIAVILDTVLDIERLNELSDIAANQ